MKWVSKHTGLAFKVPDSLERGRLLYTAKDSAELGLYIQQRPLIRIEAVHSTLGIGARAAFAFHHLKLISALEPARAGPGRVGNRMKPTMLHGSDLGEEPCPLR